MLENLLNVYADQTGLGNAICMTSYAVWASQWSPDEMKSASISSSARAGAFVRMEVCARNGISALMRLAIMLVAIGYQKVCAS